MNNRDNRKSIALDTLAILEQGFFKTATDKIIDIKAAQEFAVQNTQVYSPDRSDLLLSQRPENTSRYSTKFSVIHRTTLDAVRELIEEGEAEVLCLNFASARNPGGGFLGGSQAQEESIARSTGLYNCQLQASAYYETNRKVKSCFYTDYMIYSPRVPIIKNEDGKNMDGLITCGIITAAAVNTGVVAHREPERKPEIEVVMKRRIDKVLAIAQERKHKVLVLGAWGCGVFRNDPQLISRYFKEVIQDKYAGVFKAIVFAIYSRNDKFINAFREQFD